jgi:hypothetical protein
LVHHRSFADNSRSWGVKIQRAGIDVLINSAGMTGGNGPTWAFDVSGGLASY